MPYSVRSGYMNLEKYWWYRYRLVNDFLKIGPNCGESIPAQRRDSSNYGHLSRLEWGDATIDLGNYISVLATERALLRNHSMDPYRTNLELYYALNAYDRLDRNSDAYCYDIDATFPCNTQGGVSDGFFIRDDVPFHTFGENVSWGVPNQNSHWNRPGIMKHITQRDSWVDGSFMDKVNAPALGLTASWTHSVRRMPTEESADQTTQLAMGFALAHRLARRSSSDTLFGHPVYLGRDAYNHFYRMVDHIGSTSWLIKNPVTSSCVYGIFPNKPTCSNGGAFYYGQAYGASQFLAYTMPGTAVGNAALQAAWWGTQHIAGHKDANFFSTLAALTRSSWGKRTWKKLQRFSLANWECSPHIPYLYRVITGAGEAFRIKETIDKLDAAPGCGIHNYYGDFSNESNPYSGTYEHNSSVGWHWSGTNLLHEWYHRSDPMPGGWKPTAYYRDHNGLDYMALFNLFTLQCTPDGIYTTSYFNSYYKRNFNMAVPTTKFYPGIVTNPIGGTDLKLRLNFLEYVSLINKINDGGNLTVRGAKVVDLLPGFETIGDAHFLAYVKDYDINCGTYLGKDEHGNDIGIAGERYVYAQIVGKKLLFGSNFLPNPNGNEDTTVNLEFAPDGVDYVPDTGIGTVVEISDSLTCAQEHAEFDSLVAVIYASGDQDQIDYLDSFIIPNITFAACDTTIDSLGGPVPTYRITYIDSLSGESSNFNLYPNPNNGHFTIAFSEQGYYDVSVLNPIGIEIYSTRVYNRRSEVVRIDGLPPGIYTAIVRNSKGPQKQQVRKVIIR